MNTTPMTTLRFVSLALVLVGSAFFVVGCEAPDWTDPAYVSKELIAGDAVDRQMILNRVGDLEEDKKKEVVPALVKVYKDAGPNQKDAMSILVQVRAEAGKEAYLAELKSNATGYAGASAKALAEIGAKDALDPMLELLEKSDDNDVKLDVLAALADMPDPKVLPPLRKVLDLNVDTYPIALHAYACETIGEIALQNPDAIDQATIEAVTRSVFFANNTSQNLDASCGLAIQRIGPKAIPELVKIYKLEREDIQKLMLKYDRPDNSPFPQNHPKLVASKRLASLRAKQAVEPLIGELDEVKEAPKTLQGRAAINWRVKEGQVASETIYALGDIGDPAAYQILEDVLLNEIQERWDEVTDGLVELQLRQDAASALNRMGERKAIGPLLKMADEGVIIDFEKRAAILEGNGTPVKELERYQFNWIVAQEYAYLSTGENLDKFKSLVEKTKGEYKDLGAKFESFLPLVEMAAECNKKADDAAKLACYEPRLTDNKPEIRAKAAWEITRLSPEVAGPGLVKHLGTDLLDTREIIAFGIFRAPTQDAITKIENLLEEEENKGGAYKLDHFRLRLLHAYLKHTLSK